jgi:hypothetical protein
MNLTNEVTRLSLECDSELGRCIEDAVEGMPESNCQVSGRKNMIGEASSCVVIVALAIKELPAIVKVLRELSASLPIRRVRYGDIEAENLSSAELAELLSATKTKFKSAQEP